jgi:hypothetical protein
MFATTKRVLSLPQLVGHSRIARYGSLGLSIGFGMHFGIQIMTQVHADDQVVSSASEESSPRIALRLVHKGTNNLQFHVQQQGSPIWRKLGVSFATHCIYWIGYILSLGMAYPVLISLWYNDLINYQNKHLLQGRVTFKPHPNDFLVITMGIQLLNMITLGGSTAANQFLERFIFHQMRIEDVSILQ